MKFYSETQIYIALLYLTQNISLRDVKIQVRMKWNVGNTSACIHKCENGMGYKVENKNPCDMKI